MCLIQRGKFRVHMGFSQARNLLTDFFYKHWKLGIYLLMLGFELYIIHTLSDLPVSIGNWVSKAEQIVSFQVPSDNFYGPGAAILLTPWLWLKDNLFFVVLFYFLLGTIAFWKIVSQIGNKSGQRVALAALPLNVYLLWLINSSQDTVFEYFLLLWSTYFLTKKKYLAFSICAYLLSLTRAGYWTFFLGTTVLLVLIDLIKRNRFQFKKAIAIPLLVFTSLFNYVNFGSASPALEGGMTAYFSYTKYHYLALPKMDMDVFLSGPKGIFNPEFGVKNEDFESGAQANSELQKAAIESAVENKKETLLGWMQKIDSYIFDVQKVPHLPGRYVLDVESKVIKIENERLSWPLVLGNFSFFLYRMTLVLAGLLAIGMILSRRIELGKIDNFTSKNWTLLLPYLFGIIPGVLFYTETRFKIVSELILAPLIVGIWSNVLTKKARVST